MAIDLHDADTALELIGFPLAGDARPHRSLDGTTGGPERAELATAVDLVIEIGRLQAALASNRTHIDHLEAQLAGWQERAQAEATARHAERAESHERERDLIRILHGQIIAAQQAGAWMVSLSDASVRIPAVTATG